MRSPRIWLSWRADWHTWWADTHLHAARSANDDAKAFLGLDSTTPDVNEEIKHLRATTAESQRLGKVVTQEQDKAERHISRLGALVDRLAARR